MKYNFDTIIDRKGTGSVRWDTRIKKFGETDIIPLTTADMDFRCAKPIIDAIKESADFGVFGYTLAKPSYYEAVKERFAQKYGWEIESDWIMLSPGVVSGIAYCLLGMTEPGEGVVLPVPMYHPFAHMIEDNRRELLRVPLINTDNYYTLDFDALERQLSKPEAKVLIFCNPHNPIGRAWTYNELYRVCQLCIKHNVILISDEIHCDFVFSGHKFTSAALPMNDLGALDHLVVCSSASKSFNLAGMQTSNIIIPSEKLRRCYSSATGKLHMMELNMLGPVATEAAYRFGSEWHAQLMIYLENQRDYIVNYIWEKIPRLVPVVPEATYMIWLDCRKLGMNDDELYNFFTHKAKLGVNIGSSFGAEGKGYIRINFASPRPIIEETLMRLEKAVKALDS